MSKRLIILLLILKCSSFIFSQNKIKGEYLGIGKITGKLNIKKNNKFVLKNYTPGGNGIFYKGKWYLSNDTIVLEYHHSKKYKDIFLFKGIYLLFQKKNIVKTEEKLHYKSPIILDFLVIHDKYYMKLNSKKTSVDVKRM